MVLPQDRTVLRRHEPFLQPHAGGVPAPQGARLPDRAGDGRHHLRPVEPDSVRDGAAGRPFDDYDQYARTGRRHLRIHTRLYRGHQPAGRHAGSRIPGRHGPRIERQRKRADRAERHHRTPTVADGYRRTAIQSGQKQDDGPRVRAATIDFRRPTRIDADSVRATSHQPRKLQEVLPEFIARVYDNRLSRWPTST